MILEIGAIGRKKFDLRFQFGRKLRSALSSLHTARKQAKILVLEIETDQKQTKNHIIVQLDLWLEPLYLKQQSSSSEIFVVLKIYGNIVLNSF